MSNTYTYTAETITSIYVKHIPFEPKWFFGVLYIIEFCCIEILILNKRTPILEY